MDNAIVVNAVLVKRGSKAGSTSDHWTYCSLAIAITTGYASSRNRTNSIILYCVEQRLRELAATDSSIVTVE